MEGHTFLLFTSININHTGKFPTGIFTFSLPNSEDKQNLDKGLHRTERQAERALPRAGWPPGLAGLLLSADAAHIFTSSVPEDHYSIRVTHY